MADAGGDNTSLQFTPTWEVALVCFIIVCISIIAEKFFHRLGQCLEKKIEMPHLGALRKIKDAMMAELMLLGFVSLLLAVFQNRIAKICVLKQLSNIWLPCKKPDSSSSVANFTTSSFPSSGTQGRHLLAVASNTTDYCSQKGKVAFLSVEAVHHLHIFIFALAVIHVVLCLFKVLSMIIQREFLKMYEARIIALSKSKQSYENTSGYFVSMWLVMLKGISFMSPDEYYALRRNFITARDLKPTGKDFQTYIMRTLQKEFEEMVGISWYLWLFVVVFLLVNVAGWHALFWISFAPLILLLIVHFKLERMINQLVKAIAINLGQIEEESSKNSAEERVNEISDSDFLFHRHRLSGILIHFVLFENSLQLTFFFFILFQFGFHSCIMGKVGFVVPRIVIGFIVQLLCTCRTIPIYAVLKSQMHLKEKQSDKQIIEKIEMLLKENPLAERIKECLHDLDEIKMHLKEKQLDKQKIEKIKMLLKKNLSDECKKECLHDLDQIKMHLKEKQSDEQKIEKIKMLLKNPSDERIKECLYDLDEIKMHLKEKQSDKQQIEKINMLWKENPLDKCIKECLRDLDEIKMLLKENQSDECIKKCLLNLEEIKILLENERDEEKAMWIVSCISKWINKGISKWMDKAFLKWIDREKKPSSPEETTKIEPTRTGSREGSDGFEITECGSAGDIEAQNRQPSPHQHAK